MRALVNMSMALLDPTFKTTYGLIVAGIKPSFASVSANFILSKDTAISHTDIIPMPPPKAFPSTFAIKGFGKLYILKRSIANFLASLILVDLSEKICFFIQSKSPPAQKDFPLADKINTRVFSSFDRFSKASLNSSIIFGDKALCLSG